MSDHLCAGGCGTSLPKGKEKGFAWGHKNGCKTSPPPPPSNRDANPSTALTVIEPEVEVTVPEIDITLNAAQLDRIWQTLSLRAKGTAIATVLVTHE